jgi:hypothetical protein
LIISFPYLDVVVLGRTNDNLYKIAPTNKMSGSKMNSVPAFGPSPTKTSVGRTDSSAPNYYFPSTYDAKYTSMIPLIKSVLITNGATARRTPSADELDNVISIFQFAEENRPAIGYVPKSTGQEIRYRVEYNTWRYYCPTPVLLP